MKKDVLSTRRKRNRIAPSVSLVHSLYATGLFAVAFQHPGGSTLKLSRTLINGISLLAAMAAFYMVWREITTYQVTWATVGEIVADFSSSSLLLAFAATVMGYLVLATYDLLAIHHLQYKIAWHKTLLASFLGFAISNNAGHAIITGGAVRFRFYSSWGLDTAAIGKIIIFSSATYLLGAATLLCAAYFFAPREELHNSQLLGGHLSWLIGGVALLLAIYWLLILSGRHQLRWKKINISLPPAPISALQTIAGICDLVFAGLVLYCLLQPATQMHFMWFFTLYILAQLTGLFSQVPGGIGIFESAFLFLVGDNYNHQIILIALLTYRLIYFLLPLVIALLIFLFTQRKTFMHHWQTLPGVIQLQNTVKTLSIFLHKRLPLLLSLLTLGAGSILLFSGSTPDLPERLHTLRHIINLPLIEASHLLGSVIGVFLLILARAILLRINAAYPLTLLLLAAGIVLSLTKGLDYEEALFLTVLFLLFIPCKPYFYRKSNLGTHLLTPGWIALIISIIIFSIVIGFMAYKEVNYAHELWWQFEQDANASRFLRATLLISIIACGTLLHYLLSRGQYKPQLPSHEEITEAYAIISTQKNTEHYISLSADKYLFWSENRDSFIAYITTPTYWIALNDPCGNKSTFKSLAKAFRSRADLHGAKPVFYRITTEHLPLYVDLGLNLVKLGEEAHVDLSNFTLKGNAWTSFRNTINKINKEGFTFRIIPAEACADHLAALQQVSDQWLAHKKTREKGFSLGFFDKHYLSLFDIAVVEKNDEIVAFANVLHGDLPNEVSIDLMRYGDKAPKGAMDFLLTNIILWAKEHHYYTFNLGMAPLAGLDDDELAPFWQRLGSSVFRLGNEFYDFQGLHHYKEKFRPQWNPVYLALPRGGHLAPVIFTITNAISGGIKGSFSK
jgi:phosphatidylglycerol lysyltransferase